MAENLYIPPTEDRKEKYLALIPQVESLITMEKDLVANLANVAAAIHQTFDFLWVGFYLIKENELVLAPFQGPVACTRIKYGKGVCGTAWQRREAIIVPDVDQFPGHIACNSRSKSEIVIPLSSDNQIIGILDIDSDQPNDFSPLDQKYLEHICQIIGKQVKG